MYKHKEITQKIIACAYKVYNNLGFGFFEKVFAMNYIYWKSVLSVNICVLML